MRKSRDLRYRATTTMFLWRRTAFRSLAACAFLGVAFSNPGSRGALGADKPGGSNSSASPSPPSPDPKEREIVASFQAATARAQAGQFAEAEALYEKALARAREVRGKDHLDCGVILARLGMLKCEAKQYDRAAARFAEALPIFRLHLPPDNPQVTLVVSELARTLTNLNRDEEAARLNAENLKVREASLGRKHPATLVSLHNLGINYAHLRRWPEVVAALEEWLATVEEQQSGKTFDLLLSLEFLGDGHEALHHYGRAETCFNRELAILEADPQRDYSGQVRVLTKLVQVYGFEGRSGLGNAHKYGERCLKLCKQQFGSGHPETIKAIGGVGIAYCMAGDDGGGAKLLRERVQFEKTARTDSDEYWRTALHLAQADLRLGQLDEAEAVAWSALSALETRLGNRRNGDDFEAVGEILAMASLQAAHQAQTDEGLRKFVGGVEKLVGADDPALAKALYVAALGCVRLGTVDQGRQYLLRALAIQRKRLPADDLTLAATLRQLGTVMKLQCKYAEAETHLLECARIRRKKLGEESRLLATCLCDLGYVYARTGRYADAEATLQTALAMAEKTGAFIPASAMRDYLAAVYGHHQAVQSRTGIGGP